MLLKNDTRRTVRNEYKFLRQAKNKDHDSCLSMSKSADSSQILLNSDKGDYNRMKKTQIFASF